MSDSFSILIELRDEIPSEFAFKAQSGPYGKAVSPYTLRSSFIIRLLIFAVQKAPLNLYYAFHCFIAFCVSCTVSKHS